METGNWSIREMKKKGWQSVRAYYMAGVAAALLAYFISIGIQSQINIVGSTFQLRIFGFPVFTKWSGRVHPIVGFYLVSMMASILFKLFFNNPVEVGICRFFIESREAGASAGFDRLFWVFGSGSYLNVVKVLFLRDLYTLLWSLLLVLPGIYKQYEYAMIPYLLSENPELDSGAAFKQTQQMMEGNRFSLFCLYFSFIGWELLAAAGCMLIRKIILRAFPVSLFSYFGLMLFPASIIFVTPYIKASVVELYLFFRAATEPDEVIVEE